MSDPSESHAPANMLVIVNPSSGRGDPDAIRRHPVYLDTVDAIWRGLKRYLD